MFTCVCLSVCSCNPLILIPAVSNNAISVPVYRGLYSIPIYRGDKNYVPRTIWGDFTKSLTNFSIQKSM